MVIYDDFTDICEIVHTLLKLEAPRKMRYMRDKDSAKAFCGACPGDLVIVGPSQDGIAGQLGAVVTHDLLGLAALAEQPIARGRPGCPRSRCWRGHATEPAITFTKSRRLTQQPLPRVATKILKFRLLFLEHYSPTASSHEIATPVARRLASTDLSYCYTDNVVKLWKRRGKLLSPGEIRALHVAHRRELVRRTF